MIFDLYTQFGALNSPPVFEAFKEGLKLNGHSIATQGQKGDVAVIWSVLWYGRMRHNQPIWDWYRSQNKPVIVLEVGSIVRGHTWKIGINGINIGSYFVNEDKDNTRANSFGLVAKPWKANGNDIVICGQHERSQQWHKMGPMNVWVKDTILEIRKYSNRPIKVRQHPRYPLSINYQGVGALKSSSPTFQQDLESAWAVVNFNSGPGIEAVINGVPAFVGASSLAAPVANLDFSTIENPNRPDRQQWLNNLAWTEWTIDEMRRGEPQRLISSFLQ